MLKHIFEKCEFFLVDKWTVVDGNCLKENCKKNVFINLTIFVCDFLITQLSFQGMEVVEDRTANFKRCREQKCIFVNLFSYSVDAADQTIFILKDPKQLF